MSWQIGSTLSECVLEMCPVHGHKCLYTTTHFSRLSLSLPRKQRCRVLMNRGAVLLKHKKIVYRQPVHVHVWQWPLSAGASTCLQHCEGPKSLPSPPLPLEVGPLNPARGSGERWKLPQWGLGRSPSRQRFGAFSGWRNAAGGIQDARFETSKNGLSLRFYEEVFQYYCEGPSHRGPSQPNYCDGPDLRTLTGSTPMVKVKRYRS